ncbi:response regulator [Pseudopelagicola sp. nBUS_19]|uniref:response regulator n=1 Tax=Pseudopelagicola sp. nBUS_19 TaxID=3395316 RepID=UPI003EB90005
MVDDEEVIVEEITETIEFLGGKAVGFSCPIECLSYLRQQNYSFDLILADLSMPALNGLRLLELASKEILNTPKKFLITGVAEIDGEVIEVPHDVAVYHKPLSTQKLQQLILSIFSENKAP